MKAILEIGDEQYDVASLIRDEHLIKKIASAFDLHDQLSFVQKWFTQESFIIPTSGTTGKSKQITVRKSDLVLSAQQTLDYLGISNQASYLHCLPCTYIAGQMMMIRGIISEARIILQKPAANPLDTVQTKIDFMAITPHQLHNILQSGQTKERLSNSGCVIVGGGPIQHVDEKNLSTFDNAIYATYGMTETLSNIAMRRISGPNRSEAFELISDRFTISINEHSCLVIHSPYSHQPEVVTNDLVEIISQDAFKWLGRADDLINSGGIKINPYELEQLLRGFISPAFFIAPWPDDELGQRPIIIIEDHPWDIAQHESLRRELELLFPAKRLRPDHIGFLPAFHRTETGKIKRKESLKALSEVQKL